MRIDASNLLLAAQVQAQRPAPVKAPAQQTSFQPLDLAKSSAGQDHKQTASPGAIIRPGTQLDIKV
ncbi:MAG TPA: hypothetical protein VNH44_18750 [Micropepsaceae bacterium]|nr:hypothetical protein [Micropepsaceae bacterium]